MKNKITTIAFYLPQYHPIPENDDWWGKGFTEWTNVGRAKPLFRGHYQPKVPTDLGYYDLRLKEPRIQQAKMAKEAGINAFSYWHYWLGNGRKLLEKPFEEVLKSKEPDFPFCLSWANHSWYKKTWDPGSEDKMLIEQKYLGAKDYIAHFESVLPAFKDSRYLKVDNKPVFTVWAPLDIPDPKEFTDLWNDLAKDNGFDGIHFIGYTFKQNKTKEILKNGFDAVTVDYIKEVFDDVSIFNKISQKAINIIAKIPRRISYYSYSKFVLKSFNKNNNIYPCIVPNFDHSPRSGKRGVILTGSNPSKFGLLLHNTIKILLKGSIKNKVLFIKSWNEWGEGNYLEPDLRYGNGFLKKVTEILK